LSAQHEQTPNTPQVSEEFSCPRHGRILALDPGTHKVGVAITDETQTVVRPLERLVRTSWKKLLREIIELAAEFDAVAVVVGLPLESDGSDSEMSLEAREWARRLRLALTIPIFLEDERASSWEAKGRLWSRGASLEAARGKVDGEAAAVILEGFLSRLPPESK
jgi:putative Holliday junction resolvase